ncbi:MAG: hypothetical protein EON60_10040 [Alphaproteobacteria bacterium]|nr:MAG: hypothetical protein EON60_10040 [Alphaproteobacteria bacterium]
MRKLINLVIAIAVSVASFAAPAFAGSKSAAPAATGSTSDIRCTVSGTAMQMKVRWTKPFDGGDCNGYVSAKDFATVAKLAAQGKTKFLIRFNVVHCATGVAKMPAELRNGILTNRPWDKTCKREGESDSAFNTRAR